MSIHPKSLEAFLSAYIEAALFTSYHYNEPMNENYGRDDLHPDTLESFTNDCTKFLQHELAVFDTKEASQAGHDFWLTRNRHGAGFWDGDWNNPQADAFTKLSHEFGECYLYIDGNDVLMSLN